MTAYINVLHVFTPHILITITLCFGDVTEEHTPFWEITVCGSHSVPVILGHFIQQTSTNSYYMHEKLSSDNMLSTKGYGRGQDTAIFFFRVYILVKETGEINVQVLLA